MSNHNSKMNEGKEIHMPYIEIFVTGHFENIARYELIEIPIP